MKPLTRYWNSDYMEAQPDGDWYAKDEADAVIRELEADRDAVRADAERYRWLRDPDNADACRVLSEHHMQDPAELDAAIDAARGAA